MHRSSRLVLCSIALIAIATSIQSGVAEEAARPSIRIISDTTLSGNLIWATDIRCAEPGELFITDPTTGIHRVPIGELKSKTPFIRKGNKPSDGDAFVPTRLAASSDYLAFAAQSFSLGWRNLSQSETPGQADFQFVVDIDVTSDRLAILGLRDPREYDGAIAWLGSMKPGGLQDFEPIFYSPKDPAALNPKMSDCGSLDIGSVRFLDDGTVVLVPGVEDGVFHFAPDGKLLRTWQSSVVGVDTGCALEEREIRRIWGDFEYRQDAKNRRRIVDDILPLPSGPALIVRSVSPEGTTWEMKLLLDDGKVSTTALPISSPGGMAHLYGDVCGEEIIFLVAQRGRSRIQRAPDLPPRVLRAEIKQ